MGNGTPVDEGQAQMEMPKYRCHKEVWALKIAAIEFSGGEMATIHPADEGFAAFSVPFSWLQRYHGGHGDLGYYVRYSDGFASWSPLVAFEGGYTLIS